MDDMFSTDPGTYLTLKGTLRPMQKGRALNDLCSAQQSWSMTTILFSMGSALTVGEMMRSAQTEISPKRFDQD
jgi:hypothetical protein